MADFDPSSDSPTGLPARAPRLQDLPSSLARFCLDLESRCSGMLGHEFKGSSLVAACSGGADSTALLVILSLLARRNGLSVTVAHLDHGLRAESAADAAFVADLCALLGLKLMHERIDVATMARVQSQAPEPEHGRDHGRRIEETGRQVRYEFLERVRAKGDADLICTGHQLNDLAEDQLLRLMRGTAWPGLSGMVAFDPQRRLLRPLLLTPKADLVDLLQQLNISWREDASNLFGGFLRNRVRHCLLPLFLKENPNFLQASARLWEVGRADEEYWRHRLEALLEPALPVDTDKGLLLDAAMVRTLPQAERLRLYKAALDRLGPGQTLADSLFTLDRLVMDKHTGGEVQFPGDKRAQVEKEAIRLHVLARP